MGGGVYAGMVDRAVQGIFMFGAGLYGEAAVRLNRNINAVRPPMLQEKLLCSFQYLATWPRDLNMEFLSWVSRTARPRNTTHMYVDTVRYLPVIQALCAAI